MTAITERFPVSEITTEARQVHTSQLLLVLFLGVFWGAGWLAGKVCLGVVMGAVSVRRGWRDAYHGSGYQPVHVQQPKYAAETR
jgi:hypothetical protein